MPFQIARRPSATRWTRAATSAVAVALVAACAPVAARSLAPPANPPSAGVPVTGPAVAVSPAVASTGSVLVVGDSLSVGVEPYLPSLLPGRPLRFDAVVGRTTAQGIASVAAHPDELAPTVVVGLGTNDDPVAGDFAQHVDQMMALLGSRQVLWVNLARSGYGSLNAVLAAATSHYPNLQLVDWATAYAAHPKDQAADGIHATDAGYQLRAEIIANALGAPAPTIEP
jgi:lysophospholipase L1-like esterase